MIFIAILAGTLTAAALWLFFSWNDKDGDHLDERLQQFANPAAAPRPARDTQQPRMANALPRLTKPFRPVREILLTRMRNRLLHAGYYHNEAITRFLAVKVLLLLIPWPPAVLLALLRIAPWSWALGSAALFGLVGLAVPGLWLSWKKTQRQITFRAALPDVLDVLVICLEGGASLPSALVRVTEELRLAHPELGLELAIIEREMQTGRALGEAFLHFAERSDLEEVRSLAGCMNQTDRLGGGMVKTLRIQAESMRERRLHYAEEKAQKAGTKILFPTLLLIFPAIFVILIGPAAFQVYTLMQKTDPARIGSRGDDGKK
jgi:tight adherence protein C